jgi:hypothetical protein
VVALPNAHRWFDRQRSKRRTTSGDPRGALGAIFDMWDKAVALSMMRQSMFGGPKM